MSKPIVISNSSKNELLRITSDFLNNNLLPKYNNIHIMTTYDKQDNVFKSIIKVE